MPLPQNTRLGRYEVRSQLGAGGMGEVYLTGLSAICYGSWFLTPRRPERSAEAVFVCCFIPQFREVPCQALP